MVKRNFFGREDAEKRGNPMMVAPGQGTAGNPNQGGMFGPGGAFSNKNPFAQPTQPAQPGTAKPTGPVAPKPTEANPFLGRAWHVNRMDPGPQRQRARQDLRGDRRAYNQREAVARRQEMVEAEWLNNNAYNPAVTPPASPYANPGFDPSSGYGQALNKYFQTGVGREWIEQNPEAYYGNFMAQRGHGYGDNTAYGRYVRDRYDDEYRAFQMARGQSPGLSLPQFLTGRAPQFEQEYRLRPFIQRGEIPMAGAGATWLGGF